MRWKAIRKPRAAQVKCFLSGEIVRVATGADQWFEKDNGIRYGQSMEQLAKLRPIFDSDGTVTAGNSCPLTDGAAAMVLCSPEQVDRFDVPPLGYITAYAIAGCDPRRMGLGPVYATAKLLEQTGLSLQDFDLFEINEAFAAQVIACQKAMASDKLCPDRTGTIERRWRDPSRPAQSTRWRDRTRSSGRHDGGQAGHHAAAKPPSLRQAPRTGYALCWRRTGSRDGGGNRTGENVMKTQSYNNFRVTTDDRGVMTIALDVPGRPLNVLTHEVMEELEEIVHGLEQETSCKLAIFRSDKESGFLAGADVSVIANIDSARHALQLIERGQTLFQRIEWLADSHHGRDPWPLLGRRLGSCRWLASFASLATTARRKLDCRRSSLG